MLRTTRPRRRWTARTALIVDCDVIDVPKENGVFLESMDRIAENFERSPRGRWRTRPWARL